MILYETIGSTELATQRHFQVMVLVSRYFDKKRLIIIQNEVINTLEGKIVKLVYNHSEVPK